jgi:hypothetical protein
VAVVVDNFADAVSRESGHLMKFTGARAKNAKRKEISPTIVVGDSVSNGQMPNSSSQKYIGGLNEQEKILLGHAYDSHGRFPANKSSKK